MERQNQPVSRRLAPLVTGAVSYANMKTLNAKHFLLEVKLERAKIPSTREYPFSLAAVSSLRTLRLHPAVTFIVGENGTGKSTLLEAIAVAWGFNPEGGSQNFGFATRSSHSELYRFLDLRRGLKRPRDGYFLRAESFFNVATNIEDMDRESAGFGTPIINAYGGRSLHEQSHGEERAIFSRSRKPGNVVHYGPEIACAGN